MRIALVARRALLASLVCLPGVARADTTVPCGTHSTSEIWTIGGSPYIVNCDVNFEGPSIPRLTINPGVVVKFGSNRRLTISLNGAGGELQAVGTVSERITFTSTLASPSAGSWRGVHLYAGTAATSRIQYADVRWGGWTSSTLGAINASGCSLTIQNATIESNAYAGVKFGGTSASHSLTISASTIRANSNIQVESSGLGQVSISSSTIADGFWGIYYSASPTLSLQTVQFNNLNGVGFRLTPMHTWGTFSGVTFTNTPLAAEIVSGNVTANQTWKNLGFAYKVNNITVGGASTPVLTIESGLTLNFASGCSPKCALRIGPTGSPGNLQAVGTSSSRITMTGFGTNPPAGTWGGVRFGPAAVSASKLDYVDVKSAGATAFAPDADCGGIDVTGSSPTIDHTTSETNLIAAMTIRSGSPIVRNSTLRFSPVGLIVDNTATPSLGPAVALNNNAGYAMTLDKRVTLAANPGLTTLTATGNAINEIRMFLPATLTASVTWRKIGIPYRVSSTLVEKQGTPKPVLTIEAGAVVRFETNALLQAGLQYPGEISAVGTAGNQITLGELPTAWFLTLHPLVTSQTRFAHVVMWRPGFTVKSPATVEDFTIEMQTGGGMGILSDGGSPTIRRGTIRNGQYGLKIQGGSPLVERVTFDSNTEGIRFDGSGNPIVRDCNFLGSVPRIGIQNDTPSTIIMAERNYWSHATGPNAGAGTGTGHTVSTGVRYEPWLTTTSSTPQYFTAAARQNRIFNPAFENTKITFTTAQSGNWTVNILAVPPGAPIRTITGTGTGLNVTVQWDGKNQAGADVSNGTYYFQIESTAGANVAAPVRGFSILDRNLNLTNFNIVQVPLELAGGPINFRSIVPFTLTEQIRIKEGVCPPPEVCDVVRTLPASLRSEGEYTDSWDGKNDAGNPLPDGLYRVSALLTHAIASHEFDPSTQYLNDHYSYSQPVVPTFDPFQNQPAIISYTLAEPANVTIAMTPSMAEHMDADCDSPQFCILRNVFQGSGPHTIRWAGTDNSGRYRPDIRKFVVVRYRDLFPRTGTVLSGTKPSITLHQVAPTIFRPVGGATQTVSFTIATFNNMNASYKVEFLNQDSASVLRTVTVSSGPPGAKSFTWDGKADNGMFVAQGYYTITVTVTDAIGNVVTSQILTNVQY